MAHFVSLTASGVWLAISSRVKAGLFSFILLATLPGSASAFAENLSTDWRGGIPENNFLAYEITRKGKRLGFQSISFSEADNGDLIADIHVQIDFKLGPIPLFRCRHVNREIWRDGTLIELNSRTDNNGEDVVTSLRLEDGKLVGTGARYESDLEGVTHSTSYFDPNFVRQATLVSSQDGRRLTTETIEVGRERLNLQTGPVEATRFRTTGKLKIDIWYTDEGRWVKTEFARGGNTLNITAVNPASIPPRNKWKRP